MIKVLMDKFYGTNSSNWKIFKEISRNRILVIRFWNFRTIFATILMMTNWLINQNYLICGNDCKIQNKNQSFKLFDILWAPQYIDIKQESLKAQSDIPKSRTKNTCEWNFILNAGFFYSNFITDIYGILKIVKANFIPNTQTIVVRSEW